MLVNLCGASIESLRVFLDRLQQRYNRADYLSSDPVDFVHRYKDPLDQEAVALLSAVLAYGNVKQIKNSISEALRRIDALDSSPSQWVMSLNKKKQLQKSRDVFLGFVHRFNLGEDLVFLFQLLNLSWQKYGSLGGHFLSYLPSGSKNIESALSQLIQDWRERFWHLDEKPGKNKTFGYLLTSPSEGSACKRWCMFLRWMGRKDEIDLGLWGETSLLHTTFPKGRWLRPDHLVVPLDTHTGRISQYLQLTQRKSLNWKAALEVTESLQLCSSEDPTRYDFALSRLGILDLCQKRYRVEICSRCDLVEVCHHAKIKVERQRSKSAIYV